MGLKKASVEASLEVAKAELEAAEAKYEAKANGRLKSHPVWRQKKAKHLQLSKRLAAIDKLAARDAGLKSKKSG